MSELFLKIVNMSISASWVVVAVLALRFCLKKAPKWVNVLLWGIVAARMVFPFSIESVLSLIPSAETISPTVMMEQTPSVQTGVPALNHVINPVISSSFTPAPGASANPLQIWIPILTGIWLFGIAALFLYSAVSYWRLHRKVCEAVILRGNIYQSEKVCSPFVLGIIKPKIYLPYHMDSREMDHGADTFRPDGCSCPQSCYQPSNQQLVHARTGRKCKSAANMDSDFNGDMAFRNSSPFPLLCCELLAFAPQGLRSGNPAGQHLSKREGLLSVCAGNHQTQNLSSVSYGQPRDGSCDCP